MALLVLTTFVWLLPPPVVGSSKSMDNDTPSIESIVRTIGEQNYETLAVFDTNGRLLFETTTNESNSVTMSIEQLEQFRTQGGALVIHNHPSGTTFSAQDLRTEAERGTQRAIVVTHDYLYILTPGWRGWGNPDALMATCAAYEAHYAQEAMANESLKTSFARNRWTHDQAVAATAKDYGLEYQQIAMKDLLCFHGIFIVTRG